MSDILTDKLIARINDLEARLSKLEANDRKLGDIQLTLGDTAGTNKLSLRNSTPAEIFGINSLGEINGPLDTRITHIENQLTLKKTDTLVTHFINDTGLPSGWAWANDGVVFTGAPDNINYSNGSHWLFAYQNTTTKRSFAYRTVTKGNRMSARLSVTSVGSCGLRADDGTDNNYYEIYLRHVSGATIDIMTRSRTGGGAVTTTTVASPIGDAAITLAMLVGTGATFAITGYLVTPTVNLLGVASLGGLTWTPSRGGVLINPNQGAGAGWVDWIGWL